jgi:hypothetical protein
MSRQPATQPDLLTLIEQAREATRDLRAAMKDLKQARRDAEEAIAKLIQDAVVDHLDAVVKREVDAMGEQFQLATRAACDRVAEVCNQLYDNYMRGETRKGISIAEVMDARQTLRKWHEERGEDGGP